LIFFFHVRYHQNETDIMWTFLLCCIVCDFLFSFVLFLFPVLLCSSHMWSQSDCTLRLGQFICRSIRICILKLFVTYKPWTILFYTDSKSAVLCILIWLVVIKILIISVLCVRYVTHTLDIYCEYVWWKHIFLSSLLTVFHIHFITEIVSSVTMVHYSNERWHVFAKYKKGLFISFKYMLQYKLKSNLRIF
jgi:hypothetical protein